MQTKVAIYSRTSVDCPLTAEDQVDRLMTVAVSNGWTVSLTFGDRPMPVRKGREWRPGEDALLNAIKAGGIQKVLVWSIDRLGRSLVDLVGFMELCRING